MKTTNKKLKSWNQWAGRGWWIMFLPPMCLYTVIFLPIFIVQFIKYRITGKEEDWEL